MPKNIVVFSDGTGQEGGKTPNTNIYKLFNMIEDRTERQIAFYDRGLGTGWRKITGNVGGAGITKNIHDCYTFIFENYQAGDQIYLFGFSRGAATVRSLSSFLDFFGVLPKSRPELVKEAWRIYEDQNETRRRKKADSLIARHHTMWTRVRFLGCFDTVAALGVPFEPMSVALNELPGLQHRFHSFTLSESVENAYHALAIDDERKTFHPILWNATSRPHQHVKQVWFCGMHTDVGGGYPEQELSDIPLVWMRDSAVYHGLRLYPKHKVPIAGDVDGFMHDSRGRLWTKLFRRGERGWDDSRSDKPVVHASVLERTKGVDNSADPPYKPWILSLDYEVEPWHHGHPD